MTSDDDVLRLRDEGLSIRAIADELKLSKSAVHRMLAAADDLDDEDDLEERELALLDGNPGYEAVPPFEFVGIATVTQESPGWDVPQVAEEARFVDANGRSVSLLDIYRADFGDGSEGHGLMADARAQIERTGSGTPRPRSSGVVSVTGSGCAIPRSRHRGRAARRSTPTSLRRIGPADAS
ncbi:helix-turn-helix domain-containing protein [Mycobacterium sp.]|uniref:helix-turn-helix domain-containing protein n=1 Tax=Mycobacterium sp. TaxID=1785 RepID=UPI003F99A57E